MKDPMQQDLLATMEGTSPRPRPRPQKQFLSDELRARCRPIAWLYGQGREPPSETEAGASLTTQKQMTWTDDQLTLWNGSDIATNCR